MVHPHNRFRCRKRMQSGKKDGGTNLSLFADEDELVDLNETEEILRQLKKENSGEYDRTAALREGIRTRKPALRSARDC